MLYYLSSFGGELEKDKQAFKNNSLGKDKPRVCGKNVIWSLFAFRKWIKCGWFLKSDSLHDIPLSISPECSSVLWMSDTTYNVIRFETKRFKFLMSAASPTAIKKHEPHLITSKWMPCSFVRSVGWSTKGEKITSAVTKGNGKTTRSVSTVRKWGWKNSKRFNQSLTCTISVLFFCIFFFYWTVFHLKKWTRDFSFGIKSNSGIMWFWHNFFSCFWETSFKAELHKEQEKNLLGYFFIAARCLSSLCHYISINI